MRSLLIKILIKKSSFFYDLNETTFKIYTRVFIKIRQDKTRQDKRKKETTVRIILSSIKFNRFHLSKIDP